MYEFLATATDASGQRATHRVEADTAAEAHAQLASQGYREIVLHTDDAMAATPRVGQIDTSAVSPADQVQLRSISAWSFFFFLVRKLTRQSIVLQVGAAAVVAYRLYFAGSLGFAGLCGVAILLLPAVISALTVLFGASQKYQMLLDAAAWGRWNEVLARTPALRGKVPEIELDAREACALAGLGRLDEGLARIQKHEHGDVPHWMYLGRLAEVYNTAERFDEAQRCNEEAYRSEPDNPTVELDFAMALLKNEKETALASRLIESAENKPLGDLLQMLLPHIKGLLYLNHGQNRAAVEAFEKARANMQPMIAGSPLFAKILDINAAYLAIAQARAGDRALAAETAKPALKRLRALQSRRLLGRLESELGLDRSRLTP
jgi:hypothetical protein